MPTGSVFDLVKSTESHWGEFEVGVLGVGGNAKTLTVMDELAELQHPAFDIALK